MDFFRKVVSNLEAQHMATLTRKDIIEKQKVRPPAPHHRRQRSGMWADSVCVCVWVPQIDKEREKQRRNQLEMQKKVQEERIRREVRRAATASTALWKWVTVN